MRKSINNLESTVLQNNLENRIGTMEPVRARRLNHDFGDHYSNRQSARCDSFTEVNKGRENAEAVGLNCSSMVEFARTHLYRDTVCTLCEKTVALALDIPLDQFQARTRCGAQIALARQIAMYLCHTSFSLMLTEIGLHFRRDRTTVSYACALIEDKRDEAAFDEMINQLESLLIEARNAVALCAQECVSNVDPRRDDCRNPQTPADLPALKSRHGREL